MLEVFAPFVVWNQMPRRNLQIRVLPRGFLHEYLLWFDGLLESVMWINFSENCSDNFGSFSAFNFCQYYAEFFFFFFWVNCSSLTSCWLSLIFVIGLSVFFWGGASKLILEIFFPHLYSFSLAFSLALEVLFLLFTSFTVSHAIRCCLSSSEFLISLVWPWII